jgi:6-phosphofructokinase 1
VLSLRGAKVSSTPLAETLTRTRSVADAIASGQYSQARRLRGAVFRDAFRIVHTFFQPAPSGSAADGRTLRLGVLHCGAPAAGMNTAVRAAVRLGLERGHEMVGIRDGFDGLINGHVEPLSWMRVNGWASYGGAELGTSRTLPDEDDLQSISGTLRERAIDGLLVIGGWDGYEAAGRLKAGQRLFREFRIPIVCLPATISCNLPGTEVSIGADTALNNIIQAVDKIKHSAVAARRCFLVEVAGRYCGYLALMSGLATGAERVYLPEEGVTLDDLQRDLRRLIQGFAEGRRLALVIRNERVNELYDTAFMTAVFEQESVGFSARQSILGYLQHGGDPSALDRIQATLLAARSLEHLVKEAERGEGSVSCAGILRGSVCFYSLAEFHAQADAQHLRPESAWWMRLRPVARAMAQRAV